MKLEDVNLFAPEIQENWYPAYDVLREEAPAYNIPNTNIFVITRYDDARDVLRQPGLFSNEHEKYGDHRLFQYDEALKIYEEKGWPRFHYLSVDPPLHAKYRSLVDPFFRGEGLKKIAPFITETCTRLLDEIAPRGAAEFVQDYAVPLPVTVITKMIGFPLEDMPQLKVWSEAWAAPFAVGLSREQELDVAEKGVEFQHYIKGHIDKARAAPRDDILSWLTQANFDDERPLTDHEIMHIVDHLYIGGNETTTFALASGVWLMLREPEIYAALLAHPEKIETFVEEALRVESPTQGLYRIVTADTQVGGVSIPKGATVHIRYGAANRDPRRFGCPHQVDLSRENAKQHMAFSQGPHTCPGAGLSRLEQTISHTLMLERLSNLRLAPGKNDFTHAPGFVLRALNALHIEFDAQP